MENKLNCMISSKVAINTSDRSQAFYQKDVADMDAWFKIASRDYVEILGTFDFNRFFFEFDKPIKLLDIGCGTGKFPSMLIPVLSQDLYIQYDYLDPSRYCLDEMSCILTQPFHKGSVRNETIENVGEILKGFYDVVWSIHSLSHWRRDSLLESVVKMKNLVNSDTGIAMVMSLAEKSFYAEFHNLYGKLYKDNRIEAFVTTEELIHVLGRLDIPFKQKRLEYPHELLLSQPYIMEKYLQKCVFDNLSLSDWFENPKMADFINAFRQDDAYRFLQMSDVIFFSENKERLLKLEKFWII